MSEHWNPTKKEIKGWLDQKLHEFMVQENKTPQMFEKRWLDRYIYMEIHDIFFMFFLSKLYEWIMMLADSQGRCKLNQPLVWTPKLVLKLEASEDKIM